MKKLAKKYEAALKLVDSSKLYTVEEAAALVKKTSATKFDASVDVSLRLNVNPTLADQLIRGTITLPHGNGKSKKILVVTNTKLDEAKESGAEYFGGKELLDKITRENWFDFDIIVATPDMMGELGKMGRVLGPKGLMPNPKTGTVTMDIKGAVADIKRGKIAYRVDRDGNLSISAGRVSFDETKLVENIIAFLEAIVKARPSTVKGSYVLNAAISSTMGPSIAITFPGRN